MVEVDRGLATRPKDPRQFWKFYIFKAELTQRISGGRPVLDLLAKEGPSGREFAALDLKRKMALSYAEYSLSQYAAALRILDSAQQLAKNLKDEYLLSSIETFRAQVLIESQHPEAADAHLREGFKHAVASKNKEREAYNLHITGQLAMLQFRFEDAARALESELQILKGNKTSNLTAGALIDLGTCNLRLGSLDQALELYEKAELLTKQRGDRRNHHIAIGNIGLIHLEQHDYDNARKYLQQALQESVELDVKSLRSRWLSNLAEVAIKTKNWPEAAAYNIQGLALKRELKINTAELYSLVNSAFIRQGEGRITEAEKIFTDVIKRPSEDATPALDAHSGLAQLYASTGQDPKAIKEFEAALNVVDRARSALQKDQSKMDFLSRMIVVHDNYVDFLMSRGLTERALEVAEASRGKILQERLEGQGGSTQSVKASAYRKLAQTTGATLVSYFLGANRSYVWLTTPNQVIAYTLEPEETLRNYVENYRALIENMRDPLDVDDLNGRSLYESLLRPIADRIPKGANVIIVPDGALNALNFETIPVPSPEAHYFLEDATVSVVPSLNLLVKGQQHDQLSGRLLLIGDPDQVDNRYTKLPYAEQEINAVESHFAKPKVLSFRSKAAEPAAYLKATRGAFSFVHFTAHASADAAVPLNSAIILSGRPGSNELTAREVLKQSLDAGLVTISACRGAGAKTYAGEGLVGFMWAFFHAGAHGVIAGLWDVNDESTSQLMDQLYAGLMRGETPALALRNAKLDLRKSDSLYKLPYYWGPFQLYLRDAAYARSGLMRRGIPRPANDLAAAPAKKPAA
jgi:CHAT domain-containing protein